MVSGIRQVGWCSGTLLLLLIPAALYAADAEQVRRRHEAALANPFDSAALSAYLETLPRVGDVYIVEGDMAMAETEVRAYLAAKAASAAPADGRELLVNRHAGALDYWPVGSRDLTYAVDRASFADASNYQTVVENMQRAGSAWAEACPACGVRFRHLAEHDTAPSHDTVQFIVRQQNAQGAYVALAFFPHNAPSERWVNIDPSYFTTRFDRIGILRHELGHVLGYRHEQTRGISGCWFEDNQWQSLTEYDPHSVMHYFCGGAGSLDLQLSETDKLGHRSLYESAAPPAPAPAGFVAPEPGDDLRQIYRAAIAAPFDSAKVDALRARLPKAGEFYVVEGDVKLADSELVPWLAALSAGPTVAREAELLVNRHDGRDDYWAEASSRALTYAIDRASFADAAQYQTIRRNVEAAAQSWVDACRSCGITFRHLAEHDGAPSTDNVTFVVRAVDVHGAFIAAAFFPHDAPARRTLDIDPSYFRTRADRVGVLRHELGHVLGYRHEHIRGEAGCWEEDNEWRALTPYDAKSVMHYFCNDRGSRSLALTDVDRKGHRSLYGEQPAPSHAFLDAPDSGDPPAVDSDSTCERPDAGPGGRLIVVIRAGNPAATSARALTALAKAGALPTEPYELKPGDTLCGIYKRLGIPLGGCPPEITSAARLINGGPLSMVAGTTIKIPRICFQPMRYSRDFAAANQRERERPEELKKDWPGQVTDTQDQNGLINVGLRGYELTVPLSSSKVRRDAEKAMAALQANNFSYEVESASPKAKTRFSCQSFRQTADRYMHGPPNPLDANYFDVLDAAGAPLCTPACSGTGCPSVVIVDTPIADHPEILAAIVRRNGQLQPLPPAAPANPGPTSCPETTFDSGRHHGTHMAGIIASQGNEVGFLGVAPAVKVESLLWDTGVLQTDVANQLQARRDRNLQDVYVFASRFDYPPGCMSGDMLREDECRFRPEITKRIRNIERLWVVAAGNPPDGQAPINLTRNSSWAPMNLGDMRNVVVVTGCDPCGDNNAKLLPQSNYSTEHKLVHLAGPGCPVAGIATASECAEAGGTSQATAFVGGIAAAMKSCFPQSYVMPDDVKTRLQITSRPALDNDDASKIAAGIVDPKVALLDPSSSYLRRPTDGNLGPVSVAHWCAPELRLRDLHTSAPIIIDTKDVYRIMRNPRSDPGGWVVFRRGRTQHVINEAGTGGLVVMREGPAELADDPLLVQLEGGGALRASHVKDLIFAAPIAQTGACS